MVSRPRKKGRDHWPNNLYTNPLRYKNPKTGKFTSWRKYTLEQAIEAAKHLNSILMPPSDPVSDVIGDKETFGKFVTEFRDVHLPGRQTDWELSNITISDYTRKLNVILKWETTKKAICEVTTYDLSQELKKFPTTQGNRYRSLLVLIFNYAINEGLVSDNPAKPLIKRKEKVLRRRLTIDQFNEVYALAEQEGDIPTCRSMRLALRSLQRREDLVTLKFADIAKDSGGSYLPVIPNKTKKSGTAIKIYLDKEIESDIDLCREVIDKKVISFKDAKAAQRAMNCPFILRYPFQWHRRHRGKPLTKERLSKGFQGHRDALESFKSIPMRERPSFHEIRALGAMLYLQAGKPIREIQALLGHSNEEMTKRYLSRHGVDWTKAETGNFGEHIESLLHTSACIA
jgi:integrase